MGELDDAYSDADIDEGADEGADKEPERAPVELETAPRPNPQQITNRVMAGVEVRRTSLVAPTDILEWYESESRRREKRAAGGRSPGGRGRAFSGKNGLIVAALTEYMIRIERQRSEKSKKK